MSGVAATATGVTERVIESAPIAWLGVLPGLVVSKGRLVAQGRCRSLRVGRVRSHGLCEREQRQAQHQGRRQPGEKVVHCSKPCESSARRCHSQRRSHRPPSGRTSPVRPPAEALMGQMIRGGRSWPSEMKLGAGVERPGNLNADMVGGSGSVGVPLTKGVSEQNAEHTLHLSDAEWSCPPWSWP